MGLVGGVGLVGYVSSAGVPHVAVFSGGAPRWLGVVAPLVVRVFAAVCVLGVGYACVVGLVPVRGRLPRSV